MRSDALLALRSVRRDWLSTAIVVSVAGASAAMAVALFAMVDDVLFRPLPYPEADRLVYLSAPPESFRGRPDAELERLASTARTSELIEISAKALPVNVFEPGSEAVGDWRLVPRLVTASFFEVFGAPVLGSGFAELPPTARYPRPAVISHRVWTERFGARQSIVGEVVRIPGTILDEAWLVTGVMPRGFEFPFGANIWMPYDGSVYEDVDIPTYARMAPEATADALRAALPGVKVTALRNHVTPAGTTALLGLLTLTILLLTLSWSQFGGLAIARALDHRSDAAVRRAFGASSAEVMRPILLEAGTIAVVATAVAGLGAPIVLEYLKSVLPLGMLAGRTVEVEARALLAAGAVTVVAIVAVTLGLLWASTRLSPAELLRNGLRTSEGRTERRFRVLLLTAQVSAGAVLVYIAALSWSTGRQATSANLGFSPAGLWAVRLPGIAVSPSVPREERRSEVAKQQSLYALSLDRLKTIPGVVAVASASAYPLEPRSLQRFPVFPDTQPTLRSGARFRYGGPGYAGTLDLNLVEGRDFEPSDPTGEVVLINHTLARQLSPGESLVGRQIRASPVRVYTVIGVYDDLVVQHPGEEPSGEMVIAGTGPVLLLRHARSSSSTVPTSALAALRAVWGDRAPRHLVDFSEEAPRASQSFLARQAVTTAAAAAALPITMLGIVGSVAATTRSRRRDIATRLVLGARVRAIVLLLLRRSVVPLGVGLASGLCIAWILATAGSQFLLGVAAVDGLSTVLASVPILVAYVGAIVCASFLSIRRNPHVDLACR